MVVACGGVNVFHVCLNCAVVYGVRICVNVYGVVYVVYFLALCVSFVSCIAMMSGLVMCTGA